MGGQFSAVEYAKQIKLFSQSELTTENSEEINLFLQSSCDFYNVFTSSQLDDYRGLKKEKPQNLIFLISQVSNLSLSSLGSKDDARGSKLNIGSQSS